MRRRGSTDSAAQGARGKRRRTNEPSEASTEDVNGLEDGGRNCPVCFEPFDTGARQSARTIVHAFACNGGDGARHGICRSCDRRMYNGHGDACPICRAPRLGSSIAANGHRPPDPRIFEEFVRSQGGVPGPGGTIFFPVDPEDTGDVMVEVRRVDHSTGNTTGATAASIINDVVADPVFQAALDGLRNPQRVSVSAFMASLGEARTRRATPPRVERRAFHEAEALVEGRGD